MTPSKCVLCGQLPSWSALTTAGVNCSLLTMSDMNAGDEHWTKVLQANDVVGKVPVCPYHGKKLPLRCAFNDDVKTTPAAEDAEPAERACRRRPLSLAGAEDHERGDVSLSTDAKERTGLTTLFDRFCQWLSETRRQSFLLRLPLPKSRSRRTSSLHRGPDDVASSSVGRRSTRRHSRRRCNSASPSSSSHGDLNDPTVQRAGSASRATSTCSSMTTGTSTSTACSDVVAETGNTDDVIAETGSAVLCHRDDVDARFPAVRRCRVTSARSGNDVSTADVLQKGVTGCESGLKDECSQLISTWPSANGQPARYVTCKHTDRVQYLPCSR